MTHRLWQAAAIALAIAIVALGAFALAVFVQRTANQPRPTPTPRPTATPSPPPSASGLGSPSPSGASPGTSVSGSGEPSPSSPSESSAVPSPSDEPSPSSSAAPTPRAAVADLEFTFENVGLDDPDAADARPRAFSFFTDGSGDVRATISGTTAGTARVCLYRGSPNQILTTPLCFDGRNGFVRSNAPGGQRRQWTVAVSGLTAGRGPTTDVTVAYRGRESRVIATGFRFEGTEDQTRNGLVVRFSPRAEGPLFVDATFEVDGDAPSDYQLAVQELGAGANVIDETGSGTSLTARGQVERGSDYRLELAGTEPTAVEGVRVTATIVWP